MTRAERRRRAARKLAKVQTWVREQCPWLTAHEVRLRAKSTIGNDRYDFRTFHNARAALDAKEQINDC